MPYAPGISYDTQSLSRGIASGGDELAKGIREMQANRLMASQGMAQF